MDIGHFDIESQISLEESRCVRLSLFFSAAFSHAYPVLRRAVYRSLIIACGYIRTPKYNRSQFAI